MESIETHNKIRDQEKAIYEKEDIINSEIFNSLQAHHASGSRYSTCIASKNCSAIELDENMRNAKYFKNCLSRVFDLYISEITVKNNIEKSIFKESPITIIDSFKKPQSEHIRFVNDKYCCIEIDYNILENKDIKSKIFSRVHLDIEKKIENFSSFKATEMYNLLNDIVFTLSILLLTPENIGEHNKKYKDPFEKTQKQYHNLSKVLEYVKEFVDKEEFVETIINEYINSKNYDYPYPLILPAIIRGNMENSVEVTQSVIRKKIQQLEVELMEIVQNYDTCLSDNIVRQ